MGEKNAVKRDFLSFSNFKIYWRYTSEGAVFSEKVIGTIRILSQKTVFEKGIANWMDEVKTVTKKIGEAKHFPTKRGTWFFELPNGDRQRRRK